MTFYIGQKKAGEIFLGGKKIGRIYLGQTLVHMTTIVSKPTFLEYIESDGNQWIDTTKAVTMDDTATLECNVALAPQGRRVLTGQYGFFYGLTATGYYESGAPGSDVKGSTSEFVNIKVEKNGIDRSYYVNGKQYPVDVQISSLPGTFMIGRMQSPGFTSNVAGRYGRHTLTINDVVVFDLRPCLRGNTPCMYDMVEGKYYMNAGTGEFIAGGRFVESIVFDGASWIDTGIKPIFGDEFEITAQIGNAVRGKNYVLFGTGTSSSQFTGLIETERVFNRYFGTTAGRSSGQDTTTTYHTYFFKNDGSVYQNGKLITSPFTVAENTVGVNLTIGTRGYTNEYWLGNISSAKLIGSDSSIKLDLRPYVDSNGVACFKDVVTDTLFYNKGTGTLTYTEYEELEYLEFDGTKYIDTGMLSTNLSKWEADFQSDKAVGEAFHSVFGAQQVETSAAFRISCIIISTNVATRFVLRGDIGISISDRDINFSSVADANNRHVYGIDVKSRMAYVDNEKIFGVDIGDVRTAHDVYVMARNSGGTVTNFAKGKLYRFRHWEDGVLVQDFIPVKRSDGVSCMYDRVENKYYELKGA